MNNTLQFNKEAREAKIAEYVELATQAAKNYNEAAKDKNTSEEVLKTLKETVRNAVKTANSEKAFMIFDECLTHENPVVALAEKLSDNFLSASFRGDKASIRDKEQRLSLYNFMDYALTENQSYASGDLKNMLHVTLRSYFTVRACHEIEGDILSDSSIALDAIQRRIEKSHVEAKNGKSDENGDTVPDPISNKSLLKLLEQAFTMIDPALKVGKPDLKFLLQASVAFNKKEIKGGLATVANPDFDSIVLTMVYAKKNGIKYSITMLDK